MLIRRIGPDNQKVHAGLQSAMTGPSGQNGDIPGVHDNLFAFFSTEHQPAFSAGKAEHFMSCRMVMMEIVDSISPLRRPAISPEKALKFPGCFFGTGCKYPAIKQYREPFIVRHPSIPRKAENLRSLDIAGDSGFAESGSAGGEA